MTSTLRGSASANAGSLRSAAIVRNPSTLAGAMELRLPRRTTAVTSCTSARLRPRLRPTKPVAPVTRTFTLPARQRERLVLVLSTPLDDRAQALLEVDRGTKAQQLLGVIGATDPMGHEHLFLRAVFRLQAGSPDLQEHVD